MPLFYPFIGFCLETSKWVTPQIPAFSLRYLLPPDTILLIATAGHGACALIEVTLLVFWISVGYYALLLQLLFFQNSNDDLSNWLQGLR